MSKEVIEDKEHIILRFKDEVSAFNGLKKAKIKNKGRLNNQISALLFQYLESKGIKTQFIEILDDNSQKVEYATMIPLEIIIRNYAAGPWLESLGYLEGTKLKDTILEYRYKSNQLSDPLINSTHILSMNLCTEETLQTIKDLSYEINQALIDLFTPIEIDLIDLKLEFGFNSKNELILADSISPDTMRLWDATSKEPLDKDVFRKDLGKLDEAYNTVLKRLESVL